jgi:hypothetical protein
MLIRATSIPAGALLEAYRRDGAFADCYVAEIAREVPLHDLVETFYTGVLLSLERALLGLFARRPSNDQQARGPVE